MIIIDDIIYEWNWAGDFTSPKDEWNVLFQFHEFNIIDD
jgi:hypothetical protein